MGRALTEWQAKVAALVRDAGHADFSTGQITTVGIAPALAQFSVDRPLLRHAEAAGSDSPYVELPTGWLSGFSSLSSVEYPARANPPTLLDARSWQVVRSPDDVTVEQLLLDRTPVVGQHVRFAFTTRWPLPTETATDDLVDEVSFEAVAALAASFCCTSMLGQAARSDHSTLPTDWTGTRDRAGELAEAAKAYRASYDRFLGLDDAGGSGDKASASAPAWGSYDLDPSRGSLFHGGRR